MYVVANRDLQGQNSSDFTLSDLKPYWGGPIYTIFVAAYFIVQETPFKEYSFVPIVLGAPIMSLTTRFFWKFFSDGAITNDLSILKESEQLELERLKNLEEILKTNHTGLHEIINQFLTSGDDINNYVNQTTLLDRTILEIKEAEDSIAKDIEAIVNETEAKNRELSAFLRGDANV